MCLPILFLYNNKEFNMLGLILKELDDYDYLMKYCFLCSVIVEALKVDSLQKLCSSLEPILRRVVTMNALLILLGISVFSCFCLSALDFRFVFHLEVE